jgi:uncharacterized protein (TIGR02300 family)
MPDLGNKYECYSCGAKFYDLGKPQPICPKCGANQKDARKQEAANEAAAAAKRRRRDEVVRVPEVEEPELVPAGEDDFPDEELVAPEGLEDEDVEDDDLEDED